MSKEAETIFKEHILNDSNVKAVVFISGKPDNFIAGADIDMIKAVENGYKRALSTILDANITALIAAVILFFMASGPVRGFSITLAIGIFTSVFTAFTFTRLLISIYAKSLKPSLVGMKIND